jgi:FemAB-related protein (PEP-CTERM system-associated)
MPYVNWGGVRAIDEESEQFLLESAIQLAESRDVDYLEIRGCVGGRDSRWIKRVGHKVIMVAELPETEGQLWQRLGSKIRNQIRKGLKSSCEIVVGGEELVRAFYAVYSANMHYLGTPAHPLDFVVGIVTYFSNRCDVVVVRYGRKAVAGGILLHGDGISEVPLAACLPEYRSSCANMVLYWELLKRSVERGAQIFDFGRCTPESGSYHFKKQWGARPQQLVWHYYIRRKEPSALAKENSRFRYWQELWKRLPGPIVRWLGPQITKGLPV